MVPCYFRCRTFCRERMAEDDEETKGFLRESVAQERDPPMGTIVKG